MNSLEAQGLCCTLTVTDIECRAQYRPFYPISCPLAVRSAYFTPAQNPSGETIMTINGREPPVVDFGDGTIQVSSCFQAASARVKAALNLPRKLRSLVV